MNLFVENLDINNMKKHLWLKKKKENLVCGIRIVNYSFFIECAFVDATGIDI